ncbi:hypothetical protein MG290_10945 [Flavobacterium sp. CBA20B-1]|uniref:hypothetical protein n=1 Tax=unclassified Flavobacterium TaxID=196869 RepID=UPI002224163F|nr:MULTISPECIES: hypothetical protein [unclassified Flavobacterium]WCM41463.1 hypothetical protein MG290_10945 [Flavobacterium sp. CBA20B-1]
MTKKIVFAIFISLIIFCCFQLYSRLFISNINADNFKDFIGTYKLEKISRPEKILLLKRNKLKAAFFNDERKSVLYLKENFKQRFVVYKEKKGIVDSLIREGTWEIKKDSLLLHFPEDRFQPKIVRIGFTDKFYFLGTVYDCKVRTKEIGKEFSVLKKVK